MCGSRGDDGAVHVGRLRQGIDTGRPVADRRHGNDVADLDDLTGPGRLPADALPLPPGTRPCHFVHRDIPARAGGEADLRALLVVSQNQRQTAASGMERSFERGEPRGPIGTRLEAADRSPPSMSTIVVLNAFAEHPSRDVLKSGIQGRANGEASLVQSGFPVTRDEHSPHFLGEILGVHEARFAARADGQRPGRGEFGVGRAYEPVGRHAPKDPVPPVDGGPVVADRMVVVGPLGQRGQERRFRQRQFVERLVEIVQRGGRHAIRAETQVYLVEVELQDLILGEGPLDPESEDRFLDLALDGGFVRQQEILRHLLRDRRRADKASVRGVIHEVRDGGPQNPGQVHARMPVERLVFRRQKRVNDPFRNGCDRHEHPFLAGVLGEQRAVAGVNPGDGRRFVVRQLLIVGEAPAEMIEEQQGPARAGDSQQDQPHEHGGERPCHDSRPLASDRSIAFGAAVTGRRHAECSRQLWRVRGRVNRRLRRCRSRRNTDRSPWPAPPGRDAGLSRSTACVRPADWTDSPSPPAPRAPPVP